MTIFLGVVVILLSALSVGMIWIMSLLINRIDELEAEGSKARMTIATKDVALKSKDLRLEDAAFALNAAYSNIEMLVSGEAHADAYEELSVAFIRFSLAHNSLLNRMSELEEKQTPLFNQA